MKPQNHSAIIAAGLRGDAVDKQLAEDRITLKTLVERAITCAMSGDVLDQRSAVAVELIAPSGAVSYSGPFAPRAVETPDAIRENMAALAAETPAIESVRLLIGAELFGNGMAHYRSPLADRLTVESPVEVEQLCFDL